VIPSEHGIEPGVLALVAGAVIVWSLVSAKLLRWHITAPIAFVAFGVVSTHGPAAVVHLDLSSTAVRTLAELTLAVVLFADASRVHLGALRADAGIPSRLLLIGLPLTMAAGAGLAYALFSSNGIWLAATIGVIVAPTDAALGASLLQDERVPARVRRALNVESGLNDGIVTPFVNLFLAGALTEEAVGHLSVGRAAVDLAGGAGIGVAVGVGGALLIRVAQRSGWSATAVGPVCVAALAILAYSVALVAELNGFIAAFVGGLAFGTAAGTEAADLLAFTEEAGTLLSLVVWFLFGAVMVVPGFEAADWRAALFAVLALTLVRMVPVAIGLTGAGLDRATIAFIGWFGPRGLASVVFGLIAVDALAPPESHLVLGVVTVTVTASVVLHGVTSGPLAARYGRAADALDRGSPEHAATPPLPTRTIASGLHPLRAPARQMG
jgi:NhaP-type Na+/H+ or K+/H+ antiporter